ncbi:MAG: exodeoxyribonuclease VII small subunit [Eubacterium sp.]|nr:exodeoxyribonuclease VII small subunit [Eubacterium sp.]
MSNNKMTYETAIKRIEEIISLLEKNEISLDESMKLFEEGSRLTAFCNEELKKAEQKITELTDNND